MKFSRVATALICVVALALGIVVLVTVTQTDSRAHQANLNRYADTVCRGLAAPAAAYRSMPGHGKDDSLKAWYTRYFATLGRTVHETLSAMDKLGKVSDPVAATDQELRRFFGTAQLAAADGGKGVAGLDPDDPAFDARIDKLTGGPIAPERFNDLLDRARKTPQLSKAMVVAPSCEPATQDMKLVQQRKMLDLLFGDNTPT
ncbi:hypothetical protein [Sciscionella sediminilitoris]|uniref:hypothetical protein n=1 Tax=Sciscionella sediminilitoris TaxID=1445613 RepID=UPI0012E18778|nr:hypothetical protein [Sciscionella sp. SE31]